MRIEIHQIISNILDLNHQIISSHSSEEYIIYPEAGKQLQDIKTGKTLSLASVTSKDKLINYIEIDK